MKKHLLTAATISLLMYSCTGTPQGEEKETTIEKFNLIKNEVKADVAPDTRVKVFNYNLEKGEDGYVLKGETTDLGAKGALVSKLNENHISFIDSTVILPAKELNGVIYGVATQSVINFRTSGKYSAESATQAMMGTPVKILDKKGGWTRAVTPEGYISWVSSGSLKEMTANELDKYTSLPKVIVTTKYATITEAHSKDSRPVADVVWGNILIDLGRERGMQKVGLADGRNGFLQRSDVESFSKWLRDRKPTPDNIIATAMEFIGVPYMWGGTSIKAADCSGFTKTVFFLNGIILQRDASQQCYTGDNLDISGYTNGNQSVEALKNLKKGDLIFFGTKGTPEKKERITHVGIYIGEGVFIHAATRTKINSLIPTDNNYYDGSTRLIRAQRILGNQDEGKLIESIDKSCYVKFKL